MNEAQQEEFLNRITAIQAAAEILDGSDELSRGDRHAFLTAIQTEAARLHALLNQATALFPEYPLPLSLPLQAFAPLGSRILAIINQPIKRHPMNDTNSVESKDSKNANIFHDLGKPVLNIIEGISEAASAWQDEALEFADMRLCAKMKLCSDIVEAKHAVDLARIQLEHASTLYEHVCKAAVGYSRRLEDIGVRAARHSASTPLR